METALKLSELTLAIVRNPLVVSPDDTLIDAIAQMSNLRSQDNADISADRAVESQHNDVRSSCVLVIDFWQKIVGILTERDLLQKVAQFQPLDLLTMREVMRAPIVAVNPEELVSDVLAVMERRSLRELVVIGDRDELLGIVTETSLLKALNSRKSADISDRKQAEKILKSSEERFRRVFDSSVVGMIFADFHGNIIAANDFFLEMIGYSREELYSGKIDWLALTPPEYIERDFACMEELIERGEVAPWEKEYYRKDGSRIPILIGAAMLEGTNHETICVIADISDRKQAEHLLRQQAGHEILLRGITQRIRQSLDLNTTFDTACQEICQLLHCDRVGIFKFYPESNYDDGEFVAESVVDRYPSVLKIRVHDHCFGNNYAAAYAQGQIHAMDDIYEFGLDKCHSDILTQFQVRANLVIPLPCGNDLWGLLCVHQCDKPRHWQEVEIDLTQQISSQLAIAIQQANLFEKAQQEIRDREEAERKLRQSNHELARATRLKDEFLANMSHELRTPLNAILGITEGLQEEVFGSLNQKQIGVLSTIEKSGNHLLELINDILDLSKIEAGKLTLDIDSTNVHHLCQSSVMFVKQQAMQKKIKLEMQLPKFIPDIAIDERRIRQVLINLLNNAVKFTPENGNITLEVTVENAIADSSPKHWLKFAVIDTGIGIAPDGLKILFQPFIQIDSALNRKYEGTGLGLALVKRIVELHGGRVSVTSQLGLGSNFAIELPYTESISQTPSELLTMSKNSATASNNAIDNVDRADIPPLILLVEDNEANVITISSYLEAKGYRLVIAYDGQQALQMVRSQNPDLVLMDIQMPNMDGLAAIAWIRQNHSTEIPIIAITALAMTGDREKCLESGANDYLSKPIKLKQLATLIEQFL